MQQDNLDNPRSTTLYTKLYLFIYYILVVHSNIII